MITLETDHPVAIESPDHFAPVGTVNDNTTDADYIAAVKNYFKKSPGLKISLSLVTTVLVLRDQPMLVSVVLVSTTGTSMETRICSR